PTASSSLLLTAHCPAARIFISLQRNDSILMVRSRQRVRAKRGPMTGSAASRTIRPQYRPRRILRDAALRPLLRMRPEHAVLDDDGEPLRRPGDAGVQPARAAVLERKTLVKQHDVVPLRALRLVHGQHIAVVELVIGLALLPRNALDAAFKTFAAHRHF